jgi:hypothetical protein
MKNLIPALVKFQLDVPTIPKNSVNPFFSNATKKAMYADLATCIDKCTPVLNANGLVISQAQRVIEGRNLLATTLWHTSGEMIESIIMLPEISDPQKLTAAITYLRRAQYLAILGIVADEDDDGNSVGEQGKEKKEYGDNQRNYSSPPARETKQPSPGPTEQQLKAIYAISKKKNIDKPTFKTSAEAAAWITEQNKK